MTAPEKPREGRVVAANVVHGVSVALLIGLAMVVANMISGNEAQIRFGWAEFLVVGAVTGGIAMVGFGIALRVARRNYPIDQIPLIPHAVASAAIAIGILGLIAWVTTVFQDEVNSTGWGSAVLIVWFIFGPCVVAPAYLTILGRRRRG